MPDVVSNEELNALAAEYVLGTLDYEERKGATALLEVDPTFRGIVRIWERRFGDLHLMVEAVEPDHQLWLRIKPRMATVEQIALAIPSHVERRPAAAAVAAPAVEPAPASAPAVVAPPTAPAVDASAAETKADAAVADSTAPAAATLPGEGTSAEVQPPETKPADANPADANPADANPADANPADANPADANPADANLADANLADANLADANLADAKPAEAPPAVVEAELKLAELAALLPVTGDQSRGAAESAEPVPEDGLHTHAPDLVPRGFVPPVPMSTRGSPAVVEVPVVQKGGRGWMAATLAMALIAVALAGLISAWRFFPERLPAPLRANTVLNTTTSAAQPAPQAAPAPKPTLPSFDE